MEDTFVIEKVKKKIFLPSRDLRPVKTWKKTSNCGCQMREKYSFGIENNRNATFVKENTDRQTDRQNK